MIARMLRYSGSGAVMISELVAASAWISPASGPPPPPPPRQLPATDAVLPCSHAALQPAARLARLRPLSSSVATGRC